ncbi:putative fatty acid-binding-like protein [Mycobacterium avium subsp. avium 2285 (R)]|nr:putative fatty acid-binding-like protein [Mycobacterium avium subsp. avium 2285 (R)]
MTSPESSSAAGSGDRAVAAAAERAKLTAGRNIPSFDDLPLPADTANLREGADLSDALLALLPLVGVWRGEGEGGAMTATTGSGSRSWSPTTAATT